MLTALGRIHSADEARRAIAAALAAFDNVNIDLMYGLPGQSVDMARADIRRGGQRRRAARLGLSAHHRAEHRVLEQAAAAPGRTTRPPICRSWWKRSWQTSAISTTKPPPLPDPECAAATTSTTGNSAITSASAPARTARSASRIASRATSAPSSRRCTCKRPAVENRVIVSAELPFEFMLNALRLVEGFPLALFTERTGLPVTTLQPGSNRPRNTACWCAI